MYYSCRKLGIDWKTSKYVILGDDVLIGDHNLAMKYRDVIQSLGVEISEIKTHESDKLFEFAKRLFLNSVEITPFPISSLKESSKRFYLLVNLLIEEEVRGWVSTDGIPVSVRSFYQNCLGFNSVRSRKLQDRSFICERVMKIIRGVQPANDGLNDIIRQFKIPCPELELDQAISIVGNIALQAFVDEGALDYNKEGPALGNLALNLTIEITGLENRPDIGSVDLIPETIPILARYGRLEEEFLRIGKEAYLIDTIGKGE